jgi:hypothetical protein
MNFEFQTTNFPAKLNKNDKIVWKFLELRTFWGEFVSLCGKHSLSAEVKEI